MRDGSIQLLNNGVNYRQLPSGITMTGSNTTLNSTDKPMINTFQKPL